MSHHLIFLRVLFATSGKVADDNAGWVVDRGSGLVILQMLIQVLGVVELPSTITPATEGAYVHRSSVADKTSQILKGLATGWASLSSQWSLDDWSALRKSGFGCYPSSWSALWKCGFGCYASSWRVCGKRRPSLCADFLLLGESTIEDGGVW
ncbi:hypothetical protein F5Y05DRAFT_414052 [Hypoxylon sp. FL0543]|nr:hypothetical protein F5Y05DRAFT_414052 [Hypoxylon sp. FL0543]